MMQQTASKTSLLEEKSNSSPHIILAASILGADPLHIGRDLAACQATGQVEWVQVDTIDGHFAPNISFGPSVIPPIKQQSSLFIDVHLMCERPLQWIRPFAEKGADLITVHLEAKDSALQGLKRIRALGKKAGLAIRPKTPLSRALPLLKWVDLLLIMTVEPGFAGQSFISSCVPKIRQARGLIQKKGLPISWIEVDGGINEESIAQVVPAGANVLVCGSSMFRGSPAQAIPRLRKAVSDALIK